MANEQLIARETGLADRERIRRAFLRAFGQPPHAIWRASRLEATVSYLPRGRPLLSRTRLVDQCSVHPSPSLWRDTSAVVSMRSAVSCAWPKISDSAMVKHPACAAPMSSSGLVPGFPSNQLPKP